MTANKKQKSENKSPVKSARPSVWKSPLCTTVFTLASVIILLTISGMLSLTIQSTAFFYIIPGLFVIALFFIIILLKQVRYNFLSPLNNLRHWSDEMLNDNHSARISIKSQGEFTELFKGINVLSDRLETLTLDMQSQVKKQTKHIERKTHSLEVIYDVAASINISRDLDDRDTGQGKGAARTGSFATDRHQRSRHYCDQVTGIGTDSECCPRQGSGSHGHGSWSDILPGQRMQQIRKEKSRGVPQWRLRPFTNGRIRRMASAAAAKKCPRESQCRASVPSTSRR